MIDGVHCPLRELQTNRNTPVVTITGPPSDSLYAIGTNVSFTATFTDTGRLDTHTAYWTFNGMNFNVVPVTEPSASNGYIGSVNLIHSLSAAGVYDVSLTVKDDESVAVTASTVNGVPDRVVIYDPTAGFVTGGGTINRTAWATA